MNARRKRNGMTNHPVGVFSCGCPDFNCGAFHKIIEERTIPSVEECAALIANDNRVRKSDGPLCNRISVAANHRTLDISFRRRRNAALILLHLAWAAPVPPFNTPYGPLEQLIVREGGRETAIPKERIAAIKDFQPEMITLRSPRVGIYAISIPFGVPNPKVELISIG